MIRQLTDTDFQAKIAETKAGVCLFFKELCPHCKNMEKVLEKFATLLPGVDLLGLDLEKNPAAAAALDVSRVPTILVVKDGVVTTQKTGLMNPKEMLAFYRSH
ncbi:MAG: thioredoxin family protein [Solidesulfovibrio sp.]